MQRAAKNPGAHRDLADAAVAWCLENGRRAEGAGEVESAALWAGIAASAAFRFGGSSLCSEPLESLLWRAGRRIDAGLGKVKAGKVPHRWLHVFTQAGQIGGHAALARRWIERNPFSQRHDLVLTDQAAEDAQPGLALAVRQSGGSVASLADEASVAGRALRLRCLAMENADVVVLHIHPNDIVPSLAFATDGGPPVLLVNHADHAFWAGSAAADVVVDIRDSGAHLTRTLRGARGMAVLPVPVPDAGAAPRDRSEAAARAQGAAIPRDGLLLLTIGTGRKYAPVPGLDFPGALKRIVEAVPGSFVVAVGPSPDRPRWQSIARQTGGRVAAVGLDPDLRAWHAAADLYLESFPIGSYTALLEVALAGRAFVRKPYLVTPSVLPVDRGALAAFDPPETADAYVAAVVELCGNRARREEQEALARESVLAVHCGAGWTAQLDALAARIPAEHESPGARAVPPMPVELRDYWNAYYARQQREDPVAWAAAQAAAAGLAPVAPVPAKVD